MPLPVPAPAGFAACASCPYRHLPHPEVCLACFEAATGDGGPAVPRCGSCGHPRPGGSPCPLAWCSRRDRGWSVVWEVGAYEGALRRALLAYKYRGAVWWAGVFARILAGYLERNAGWFDDFDILTAVPAFEGHGARRAWDPVGRVLAEAAPLLGPGWEVHRRAVGKLGETPPFSGRDRRARILAGAALRQALVVPDPAVVAGRRVLVLDDVLAEGGTLREVAAALRAAGAREVAGVVVARGRWKARAAGGR